MSTEKEFDCISISDTHLGAPACRTPLLSHFLANLPPTKRLVLNGDVLEGTEGRLKKPHWAVLSQLRRLSDRLELVWVAGNHDPCAESVAHLVGASFVADYVFRSGPANVLCVHGDAWDDFLSDHPCITWLADLVYMAMQKLDPSHRLAYFAKRRSKTFLRCQEKVARGAVAMARRRHCQTVLCGHTHQAWSPLQLCRPGGGAYPAVRYLNSGCWTEPECHYVGVREGLPTLYLYREEAP